jgi:hypothetical protein
MPSRVPVRALARDACECGGEGRRGEDNVETGGRRPLKLHWFVCSEQQKESAPHEKLGRGRSRRRQKGGLGKLCAMLEDPHSQTTSTSRISHVAGGQGRMRMLKKKTHGRAERGIVTGEKECSWHSNGSECTSTLPNTCSWKRGTRAEDECVGLRVQRSECKGQRVQARVQPCSRLGNSSAAVQET